MKAALEDPVYHIQQAFGRTAFQQLISQIMGKADSSEKYLH